MILVDTCAIVWDAFEPARLSPRAKEAITTADENGALLVADISLWEIAMLMQRKSLCKANRVPSVLILRILKARNFTVVPISPEIAQLAVTLDSTINNDPADRLIAATSILKQAPLVTADKNLRRAAGVTTVW